MEKKGFRILEGIKYVYWCEWLLLVVPGGSCCGCGSYGAPPPSRGKRGGKTLRLERLSACALKLNVSVQVERHFVWLFYQLTFLHKVCRDDGRCSGAPCVSRMFLMNLVCL
jgi:hypothetical protein